MLVYVGFNCVVHQHASFIACQTYIEEDFGCCFIHSDFWRLYITLCLFLCLFL
jgi:hypothetical protein